jgi:hypothetical protein
VNTGRHLMRIEPGVSRGSEDDDTSEELTRRHIGVILSNKAQRRELESGKEPDLDYGMENNEAPGQFHF